MAVASVSADMKLMRSVASNRHQINKRGENMFGIVEPAYRKPRISKQRWMGDLAEYGDVLSTISSQALELELWRRHRELNEIMQSYEQFDRTSGAGYGN